MCSRTISNLEQAEVSWCGRMIEPMLAYVHDSKTLDWPTSPRTDRSDPSGIARGMKPVFECAKRSDVSSIVYAIGLDGLFYNGFLLAGLTVGDRSEQAGLLVRMDWIVSSGLLESLCTYISISFS